MATPMRQLITRYGGVTRFARITGIPRRTVSHWASRKPSEGRQPPAWLAALVSDAMRYRSARAVTADVIDYY
ncbi:MAG: hypothetical protein ABIK89_24595 [Planctomycetota bacterium]